MKRVLYLLLFIILMTGCISVASAAETVTERPDIKITIDGVTKNYENTPIIVNGRTLLPLRELLENLGVANDDQHIIWNAKDNSVTVKKDSTTLFLKVGSTEASVNGNTVAIDAAPVNYNGKVFIPARFVAEAFQKVVAWDKVTKRIYIKNQEEYKEVMRILDQSVSLMESAKRMKVTSESTNHYTNSDETSDSNDKINVILDLENMIEYYSSKSDIYGEIGNYEAYTVDHRNYSKFTSESNWDRTILSDADFADYIYGYSPSNLINPRDVLYASLTAEKDQTKNLTYLKGDVYRLTKSAESDASYQANIDGYDDTYMEITIDNKSGYITQLVVKDNLQMSPPDIAPYVSESYELYTFDVGGKYSIALPAYIANDLNTAVDNKEPELNDGEKAKVEALKNAILVVSVDGLYANPYTIDSTEAMVFCILKDETAFNTYSNLSDNAKIMFSNTIAQEHINEYLGCSEIHAVVVYDGKAYSEIITDYGKTDMELTLKKLNGTVQRIVVQDKEKDSYSDY